MRASPPRPQPFTEFFAAWSGRPRAEFLRATKAPCLIVPQLGNMTAEQAELPTDKVDADRAVAYWDLQALLPVRRRDRGPGRITLGRAPTSDLCIPDSRISKQQAWLEQVDDSTWLLGDAGSTNGTRLDSVPLTSRGALLRSGSRIRLAEALDVVFVEPAGLYGIVDRLRRAIEGARGGPRKLSEAITPAPATRRKRRPR